MVLCATPRYRAAWPSVSHSGSRGSSRALALRTIAERIYPKLVFPNTPASGSGHGDGRRRWGQRVRAVLRDRRGGLRIVLERLPERDADDEDEHERRDPRDPALPRVPPPAPAFVGAHGR